MVQVVEQFTNKSAAYACPLPLHQRSLLRRQAVARVHQLVNFSFQRRGVGGGVEGFLGKDLLVLFFVRFIVK